MGQYILITNPSTHYLAHHGIAGQRWGVVHGPPYPLARTANGRLNTRIQERKKRNAEQAAEKRKRDPHDKEGSTAAAITALAANVAVDALTLNPIGAALDLYQIGAATSAAIKENSAAKRLAKAEIDKKTGLPLKKKELTAEQDMRLVNPGYHNFNTNTKNNCVLCTAAFELRRRGYDVIAAKAGRGYNEGEYDKWFKNAKTEFRSDSFPQDRFGRPTKEKALKLRDWANDKILPQGEGARGSLSISFDGFSGHSLAYEVKDGKVQVYDAQSGRKMNLISVASMSTDIGFSRLDDKQPDFKQMRKSGVIS